MSTHSSATATAPNEGLQVKEGHEHSATVPEGQAANDTRPAAEQVGPTAQQDGAAGAPGKPKLDKFAYGCEWAGRSQEAEMDYRD